MKYLAILLAIAAPSCTVYRPPSGAYFSQVGGKVHIVAADFELMADNEASFKDGARLVTSLGLAQIAAGAFKAQDASKAATDQKAISAGAEKEAIAAGTEKARLAQEVDLRKLELEMMEVVP
jgi:hypothetical protein